MSQNETDSTATAGTTATAIINFHGVQLCVATYEGVEYIYAKRLSDLAGVDWRTTKEQLQEEENVALFGIQHLSHPDFVSGGGVYPPTSSSRTGIYMRIDRAHMYLARISVRHMKARGNVEAAGRLLALQIEWAEALHQYETTGVAFKRRRTEQQDRFVDLLKAQRYATNAVQREALNQMINESLADAGYPVVEPQQSLAV